MGKTNVEYATDQITVYPDCPFECRYCWASTPLMRYRTRKPQPIQEAERYRRARKARTIVISFTTDPYQPREEVRCLTRQVLRILDYSKIKHRILLLTKNPMLAFNRDGVYPIKRSKMDIWLGTTVTELRSIPDEPKAPSNGERLHALECAHALGIKTWMSIEPWLPYVTDPIEIIEETHRYVDWYVIGRLDYETRFGYQKIPKGWYSEPLEQVIEVLEKLHKPYHIKKQLKENP